MSRGVKITAPCLGCEQPIEYRVIQERGCAPEVVSRSINVHAYQAGHLCMECAQAVDVFLRGRRLAKTERAKAAIGHAQRCLTSAGEIEVDDDPRVSPSESGCYVAAWIWVDNDQIGGAS